LAGLDLREVGELTVGTHEGPSSVGLDTLWATAGGDPTVIGVPEPFHSYFIACGVPEAILVRSESALGMLREITSQLADHKGATLAAGHSAVELDDGLSS